MSASMSTDCVPLATSDESYEAQVSDDLLPNRTVAQHRVPRRCCWPCVTGFSLLFMVTIFSWWMFADNLLLTYYASRRAPVPPLTPILYAAPVQQSPPVPTLKAKAMVERAPPIMPPPPPPMLYPTVSPPAVVQSLPSVPPSPPPVSQVRRYPQRVSNAASNHLASNLEIDLALREMPIIGEARRWRRPDEHGLLFNMRNSDFGPSFDTACAARIEPLPDPGISYHIVRLLPYVSTYAARGGRQNVSIVHHMDLFVCDGRMSAPRDDQCMNDDEWLRDDGPCYAMLWAYDKGALAPFDLPADAGFRVGAGTRYTHLLLQVRQYSPCHAMTAYAEDHVLSSAPPSDVSTHAPFTLVYPLTFYRASPPS